MQGGRGLLYTLVPYLRLVSSFDMTLFIVKKKGEVTTLLLSTLLTIAAGFEHRGTKYMSATGILLFSNVLFHVVLQINQ